MEGKGNAMKKIKIVIAVFALSVASAIIVVHHGALAESGLTNEQKERRSTIVKKALLQGLFRCASGRNSKNKVYFKSTTTLEDYRDRGYFNIYDGGSDPSDYYLPTNKNNEYFSVFSAKNDKADCETLMTGGNQWSSAPSAFEALGSTMSIDISGAAFSGKLGRP